MFFTYLHRELRHRMRQSVFVSLGLALGIGLERTRCDHSGEAGAAMSTLVESRSMPIQPLRRCWVRICSARYDASSLTQ